MSLDTFSKIKPVPENSVNVFVQVGLFLRAREEEMDLSMEELCQAG